MDVVTLRGDDLATFLEWMASIIGPDGAEPLEMRVGIDEEGVKFSVDHGIWSPGIGQL